LHFGYFAGVIPVALFVAAALLTVVVAIRAGTCSTPPTAATSPRWSASRRAAILILYTPYMFSRQPVRVERVST
jgi:hypothetical protein